MDGLQVGVPAGQEVVVPTPGALPARLLHERASGGR